MGKNIGFKSPDRVRIATLDGRVILPYLMGAYQEECFGFAHGQADRVLRRDGKWFLLVTVDVPDGTPLPITDCIGVALGVVTLATTSDAETHTGETVEICRTRYARRRQRLQRAAHLSHLHGKRPKNIRRALQRTSRREAAFRRDVNHGISQRLVASATDTNNADYNGALNIRYRALVSAPEVAGAAFQPRQRLAGGTPATSCLL